MRKRTVPFAVVLFATSTLPVPAQSVVGVSASKCLTIQPSGPRSGDAGVKYLNIEGKDNEKYASFGVLVFEVPREVQGKKLKSLTLSLVQSVPKFSKDGPVKFFLAPDVDPRADLKFDPNAPDGVGSQLQALHVLGSANFKKVETGTTDSYSLTLDDTARERIARAEKLYLVIAPSDATVAATYFGASEDAREKCPRLTFDLP
jgi:hypothetical protein